MKSPIGIVKYVDIGSTKELRDFFDIVRKLLNIQLGLAPLSLKEIWPTARPRHEDNPVCRVIQEASGGAAACLASDKKHCTEVLQVRHGICYICYAGVIDFIVPIAIGGRTVAVLIGGQVLPAPPSEKGFEKLLKNLKAIPVDREKLRDAYFRMPFLTKEKAESTLKLITLFAEMLREKGIRLKLRSRKELPDFLKAGLDYMNRYFRNSDLSLESVAEHAAVSVSHFGWSFKKHLNILFNHYLLDLRMSEAEKLLSQTDKKVSEIAILSGFGSLSHFNRVFKTRFHRSPRQYRNH